MVADSRRGRQPWLLAGLPGLKAFRFTSTSFQQPEGCPQNPQSCFSPSDFSTMDPSAAIWSNLRRVKSGSCEAQVVCAYEGTT
jgi:hypothetical protein